MELNYDHYNDNLEDNFGIDDINGMNDDELFELLDQIDYEKENKEISEFEQTMTEKEYEGIYCKKCKTGDKIAEDTSQGIVVCMGCGTILSEIFDDNPEWKQYANDDNKDTNARCGNSINFFLPQSSLGTTIGCSNRNRVKILHNWSAMPYKERSLNIVLKEIQNKCRIAGILKCIEDDAKILYKNISESKHLYGKNKGKNVIIRGANRKSLIASCVFFACKRKGKTRSPKEIARLFDLKYKDITKGCKTFLKLIKLKHLQYDTQISNAEHFIIRYCRQLHITNEYINQAMQIAKNIQKINIASMHTPFSVATGSILLVADLNKLNIDRKIIAEQFNVSEVTVIKTYKKLEQYKHILINDELTEKIAKLIEEDKKKLKMPDKLKTMYNTINEGNFDIDTDDQSDNETNQQIKQFTINDNNIEEYINDIDIELYDTIGMTNDTYKSFIQKIKINI
ncbi:transcription factor TFIIB [Fadolivirus algeromassiliense]|jgi:transcription initiation factor TFIIIB Brf1 subunit/transcription initiation factor TFIIB|uniref:Transcription factor TFIIB n=1 Tax=Fadolivirus FV1/VV64 TaxID=3070911 RepID=A0A7D3V8U1_9VIRU|nr:transcription factor TFIIB [Fadolivirus algeromassiliense]QKF94057.1 transcription factor TFIIB [Fadolivirus FV1/VV64]